MRKFLIGFVCVCLVVAASFQAYRKITAQSANRPRSGGGRRGGAAVAVEVKAPSRRPMVEKGAFTGSLLPRSQFCIAPKISGQLTTLKVNIGDYVNHGDLIATMDDLELRQKVEEAKADLAVGQSRLDAVESVYDWQIEKAGAEVSRWSATAMLAKKELERQEQLRKKSVASETEIDKAKEQLQVTSSQLVSAEKNLELLKTQKTEETRRITAEVARTRAALGSAEVRLDFTRICAIWSDGAARRVVGERFVDEGAMLGIGSPIISILDIDSLKAVISVTEKDYTRLSPGQIVKVATDAYPGKSFDGSIVRIAPVLDEASRVARVEIEVPNPGHLLKPGMYIRASIVFSSKDDAAVVPIDAVVKRDGSDGVFRIDRTVGKAFFVPIVAGIVDSGFTEVMSPVLTSEVVILGHHMLSDATSIILPDEAAGKGDSGKEKRRGKGGAGKGSDGERGGGRR